MGVGEYLSRGGYPSMEGIVTAKRPLVSYVSKFRKLRLLRGNIAR